MCSSIFVVIGGRKPRGIIKFPAKIPAKNQGAAKLIFNDKLPFLKHVREKDCDL